MILALLFTAVLASGPAVDIDNPDDCIDAGGYLAGEGFPGGDCCSFVVCNAANLNKTGFIGKCMGATVWNDAIKACDDAKYVTTCDPTSCDVPSRTTSVCPAPQPTTDTCCVGQNIEDTFPGYSPVFTQVSPNEYMVAGEREVQTCPNGQVFNLDDCCCEFDYIPADECTDLSSIYFINPADPCCSYLQCYANRTGFIVVDCMPPSVWNDINKACDITQNVMECMDELCGPEMTDFPCDGSGIGDCCRAGVYFTAGSSDNTYVISDYVNPDLAAPDAREQCCPDDMDGNPQVFNNDQEVCCCEPA